MIEKWDKRFLRLAREVSTWSKDPSTKVGAVLVRGRRIIATGYNGLPVGMIDDERLESRSLKYPRVVHAEMNAILFAGMDGTRGAKLYVWGMRGPCNACCKHIIQAGIVEMVCAGPKPRPSWERELWTSKGMLQECGVNLVEFDADQLD